MSRADVPSSISLCMIVRDAERSLSSAILSAAPFVQDIVVVDTGSQDRTRQVAADLKARTFDFAWCDDFSAARNYSLEQARGDWILWMDADDVLPEKSGQELRQRIAEHPLRDVAFWVTIEESVTDSSLQPRVMGHAHLKVFPRHPQIRFCYRVHEQVSPSLKRLGMRLVPTDAVIRHEHADRLPQAEAARTERNRRLCEMDLQERPDDPFVQLNLGATYLFLPDKVGSAIELLAGSIRGLPPASSTQLNAYLFLGQAYAATGDIEGERTTYREALAAFPRDATLLLRYAATAERLGMMEEAEKCYQHALQSGVTRLSSMHVRDFPRHAAQRLGMIYARTGRPHLAERLWQQFLAVYPDDTVIRGAVTALALRTQSIIVSPPH